MGAKGYNGWTNYPTWAAYLWLANDPDNERKLLAAATTTATLRDYTRDIIEEAPLTGLPNDLLRWAFGLINWGELQAAILDH